MRPDGSGTLRGCIVSAQTGQPIAGATVVARAERGRPRETTAPADGRYEIGQLLPGAYPRSVRLTDDRGSAISLLDGV